jgi:ATP-dependent DNA helicase DinG
MPESTRDVLARITAQLPGGGELRPGQVRLAEAVASAFATGRHLVAAAGTGTGKSLAYLVPAALTRRRVVVVTATKTLQDQLANNDLPLLAQNLFGAGGRPRLSFCVLKGRSNYLCRQKVAELRRPSPDVVAVIAASERTATGDRAELAVEPSPAVWSALATSSTSCPGAAKCPSGETCRAEAARQRAEHSDIVVVNAHLYGAHLANDSAILPRHDLVVFDEAHELEDIFAHALGLEVRPAEVGEAVRGVAALSPAQTRDLIEGASRLTDAMAPLVGERLGASGPIDQGRHSALAELERVAGLLEGRLDTAIAWLAAGSGQQGLVGDDQSRIRCRLALEAFRSGLRRLAAPSEYEVGYIEGRPEAPVARLASLDVAQPLKELIFSRITAVLTSATMPTGLADRLGVPADRRDFISVESPFDYRHQAMLYCPRHLPDRRSAACEAAIGQEILDLIQAARGRTLALFTSRRAMNDFSLLARTKLHYPILTQDDLPKPALLRRFRAEPEACLFATMGFWQGVDVPGPSLSLVIIDRLPFPRPDEPLAQARRQLAGERWFSLVDLPRAATLLAQGAGRLIRSADDQGVVAILDTRLATASYRQALLDGFPPMVRTTNRAAVLARLGEIAAGGPKAG